MVPSRAKHHIWSPLRLFELFFDEALVDMIVGYTKLYGHGQKADISFEITDETFSLFFRHATD